MVRLLNLKIGQTEFTVLDFVRPLKDGKYAYYSTSDSGNKNLNKYLRIEGEFLDNKKTGEYRYYTRNNDQKANSSSLYIVINYRNGELNGQYTSFITPKIKIEEGNFINGKKDGFFIVYDSENRDGTISEINLFNQDSLKDWVIFYPDGKIRKKGVGIEEKPKP